MKNCHRRPPEFCCFSRSLHLGWSCGLDDVEVLCWKNMQSSADELDSCSHQQRPVLCQLGGSLGMLAERARACQLVLKCNSTLASGTLIVAELPGSFGLLTPWR